MSDVKTEMERTAALKTYILWAWLEQDPYAQKQHYPLFDDLGYARMPFFCPWCDLLGQSNEGIDTRLCDRYCTLNCTNRLSRFHRWASDYNTPVVKKAAAGNIAALAWAKYKRLGG